MFLHEKMWEILKKDLEKDLKRTGKGPQEFCKGDQPVIKEIGGGFPGTYKAELFIIYHQKEAVGMKPEITNINATKKRGFWK